MRGRPTTKYFLSLERLEPRLPLSAGASMAPLAHPHLRPVRAEFSHGPAPQVGLGPGTHAQGNARNHPRQTIHASNVQPRHGFLVFRITQPNMFNNHLTPPFKHVLVQDTKPVPGQTYNLLYVAVRNGTAQTFDSRSGFFVKFPGQQHPTSILKGDQVWKPGEEFVFYVLTKKYYPINNQVTQGFEFRLDHARSIAIPGPSGIFLRLKYNPSKFDRTLDAIVAFGAGAQGGVGPKLGLPDTAINEFVSAKTERDDFGGYF